MNYIAEIKSFYDGLLSNRLTHGQIALWHALMEIDNRTGWQEWFHAPYETLMIFSGLSRSGVCNGVQRLVELGYIEKSKSLYRFKTNSGKNEQRHLINNKTKPNETKLNKTRRSDFDGKVEFYKSSDTLPRGNEL